MKGHAKEAVKYANEMLGSDNFRIAYGNKKKEVKRNGRRTSDILKYVEYSPKTPSKIAEESGINQKIVCHTLRYLEEEGRIDVAPDQNGIETYCKNIHYVQNQEPSKQDQ